MKNTAVLIVFLLSVCVPVGLTQTAASQVRQSKQSATALPSEEEIRELLDKASEYVDTYRQTFANTKASLDKAPTPGFYDEGMKLSSQAAQAIDAIRKNGSSAYELVGLIAVLDDMSLNAARASAAAMLVEIEGHSNNSDHDFLALAQAEKNCYDISELILHATLRYISVEESALKAVLNSDRRR